MSDDDDEPRAGGAWAEYPLFRGLTAGHRVCQCAACGAPLLSREHKAEKGHDPYGGGCLPPLVRAYRLRRLDGEAKPHKEPFCRACWEASHKDRRPAWSAVAGGKYAVGE